jgi:hypothetical protein
VADQVRRSFQRVDERLQRGEILTEVERRAEGPWARSAVAEEVRREHAVGPGQDVAELAPLSRRKTAAVHHHDGLTFASLVHGERINADRKPPDRRRARAVVGLCR